MRTGKWVVEDAESPKLSDDDKAALIELGYMDGGGEL